MGQDIKNHVDYLLAAKLVRAYEALDIANDCLHEADMIGIIPSQPFPSFGESKNFYKKVRKIIDENSSNN